VRILVVNWQDWTHPRAGGAEIHLRETFGRIARAGHRVDLLCVAHEGAPAEDRLEGINVIRRGGAYRLFNYTVPGVYRRVLRRNRYDVVVDDLNKIPFFAPLWTDRPVVALVHHLFGRTVFAETNPVFGSYVWAGEVPIPLVYRDCPFIAVSPSTADDLVERGVQRDSISVIPNGLPDRPWDGATWADLLAEDKSPTPLFAYVGRIKRYKAIEIVLEAFARLVDERPAARLVIAGDGDHRPALQRTAGALDLGETVSFPGWIEDREKWLLLRRAWGVCYTSPKEGWGFSSLEAQRAGTVALVSDVPGLRDTVVDGVTGRALPHGDVDALVAGMREVIDRPAERASRETAAIERACGFTWRRAADETLALLEGVVGEGA